MELMHIMFFALFVVIKNVKRARLSLFIVFSAFKGNQIIGEYALIEVKIVIYIN